MIGKVLLVANDDGRYAIGAHDYILMVIVNSGPSRLPAGRAKIRSRLDVTAYFLYENDGKQNGGEWRYPCAVEPTRFIGMNSIVGDPVSRTDSIRLYVTATIQKLTVRIVPLGVLSELETGKASPVSPKP
jgi:hypothetical protein